MKAMTDGDKSKVVDQEEDESAQKEKKIRRWLARYARGNTDLVRIQAMAIGDGAIGNDNRWQLKRQRQQDLGELGDLDSDSDGRESQRWCA